MQSGLLRSLLWRGIVQRYQRLFYPSGFKFPPLEKTNAIAECLENQFTPRDLCEENDEQGVGVRVQAFSETLEDSFHERVRPCDV
jgi:hypothetical protein